MPTSTTNEAIFGLLGVLVQLRPVFLVLLININMTVSTTSGHKDAHKWRTNVNLEAGIGEWKLSQFEMIG